jgi:hypothetical protein
MSETLVTIERYFDVTEAHIAAGFLESEGIHVHLPDVNHVSANWTLGVAVGVRVQVPESQAQEARLLLASRKPLDEEVTHCPRCDSVSVTEKSASQKLAMLSIHILQIPLPWRKGKLHCGQCGHEWLRTRGAV